MSVIDAALSDNPAHQYNTGRDHLQRHHGVNQQTLVVESDKLITVEYPSRARTRILSGSNFYNINRLHRAGNNYVTNELRK